VLRPPPPRCASSTQTSWCASSTQTSWCASSTQPSSCAYRHKIPKLPNHSTNSYFIFTSLVPILQQRCLSKASCRRQRIMARAQRFLDPPQMLRPGDACHRCPLMGQVQEPFSNVASFLVACFGCCER
jgi:hypothetical protein